MDTVGICLLACICIIHVIPLVTLAWTVFNTSSYSFLPRKIKLVKRRNRNVIFPHVEDLLRLNNPILRRFLGKYALAACAFHLLFIMLFVLALHFGLPLPFIPKLSTLLPEGVLDDYTRFSIICGLFQLLPILTLVFVLYFNKRMPFLPVLTEETTMTKADITCVEEISEDFGYIRLSRFVNSKKTILFANCKDYRSGRFFKLALIQEKGEYASTDCFRIKKKIKTLTKLNTPPFYVDDMVGAFDAVNK